MRNEVIIPATLIAFLFSSQGYAINVPAYIQECTPKSHWGLLERIVRVESNGNPFAINVNRSLLDFEQPKSLDEAKDQVRLLARKRASFDIGLTQINSYHFGKKGYFRKLGLSYEDALDPCTNLKMSAYLISDAYRRYKGDIYATISAYNTGSPTKGIKNGYVDKVFSPIRK